MPKFPFTKKQFISWLQEFDYDETVTTNAYCPLEAFSKDKNRRLETVNSDFFKMLDSLKSGATPKWASDCIHWIDHTCKMQWGKIKAGEILKYLSSQSKNVKSNDASH